ncbi:MAG: FtsX-like permease family protein, partial [Thermoanaerobaculia bacterium]|nr:FtsX-like permease family protein [Thermoanaerobaculia bacterium]
SAQARSLALGFAFTGGLALLAALLWAAARGLAALSRRAPRRGLGVAWRYGLAALGRPGAATLGAVVSLGLGVMVVLALSLVQRQLSRQLLAEIPAGAPNAFLVDIQTAQGPPLERRRGELGAQALDSVPVGMARRAAIDGVAAAELAERTGQERGERRWALTREQRLTYLERLPDDNTLVAGALWSDPERAEVSVEEEFARDLGLALGSRLAFDVQGVPVELVVTSLRRVRWESFGINFFLVVEPGVLDGAPQQRLATARFPAGGEQRAQDALARDFPNVTLLQVRELLEKVAAVMRRIGLGVRFLGGFTVVAGIAILAGAIGAASARRGREVALLKALGMGRRQVVAALALEYGLVGLVAGAIGTAAALLLSWAVLTHGMEVRWALDPLPVAVALAGTVLLAAAAGLGASLGALARRPVEALRHE